MYDYEVMVIGGGQAGLAIGHMLKKEGLRFVILEKEPRVGNSWRERYDALVLFTPRRYSDLPGFPFPGDRDGLPGKDDAANYLEAYSEYFQLPIMLDTDVGRVEKVDTGFRVHTQYAIFHTRFVVVATGPFQQPSLPSIQKNVSDEVVQLHTAHYKNEHQLKEGPVLVVGAGNSGAQIATELASSRPVVLSVGQKRSFVPLSILGKTIFWYMRALGMLDAPLSTWIGKRLSQMPDPIFGYQQQIRSLEQSGQLRLANRTLSLSGCTATFEGGNQATVANIIWATGFRFQYDWLHIPEALDDLGRPLHLRGVSPVQGLYYLGLPWQHSRSSALMGGVGTDAQFLAKHMKSVPPSISESYIGY